MIQTFQYYVDSNLRWHEIAFEDCADSDPFFRVVEAVAKLKLFRRVTFRYLYAILDHSPTTRFSAAIALVIREGRHLECVNIENFNFSANATAALATGGQTVGLSELRFSHTEFMRSGELMDPLEYLAAGLASNSTLKKFRLINCWLNDTESAGIIQALARHPSVEVLELCGCQYGTNAVQSIHRWLRWEGCRLRELGMNIDMDYGTYETVEFGPDGGRGPWSQNHPGGLNLAQLFVQDLPPNNSLEHLSFVNHLEFDEDDINALLRSLPKLPNLGSLEVRYHTAWHGA